MFAFRYKPLQNEIFFGQGSLCKLPSHLKQLQAKKPLLLSTPGQISRAELVSSILDTHVEAVAIFSEATMHTPLDVTEKALEYCRSQQPDVIISIGGGSTIGLGKALSVRNGLHHIAIPTTYAGSEVTPILGETVDGVKTTRSASDILPKTVIYDIDLTMTLPISTSISSGVIAIAHAIEALYASNTNPIVNMLAMQGIKTLATALPRLLINPDIGTRSMIQYGAWLCGTCLGSVNMSLHRKLCHTLGGSFNLPHAETHAVILPHVLAYNAPRITNIMGALADVLPSSSGDALKGLNNLLHALNAPRALKSFGFREEDIDRAADLAVSKSYDNPREIERDLIRELIRRALAGEDARVGLVHE